jgi:hypothetical protein
VSFFILEIIFWRNKNMRKLTHEQFIQRLEHTNQYYANGDFIVIGEYINKRTKVKCQCICHHYIWSEFPEKLYFGATCPLCRNKSRPDIETFRGKPSLWDTHPHIAKLLKSPKDGYKYTHGSTKILEFVCPDCGNIISKSVFQVNHNGLCCEKCSDGVSMPNKYSRALLDQLPIEKYICEFHPVWARQYRYDNYFEYDDKKYILEMDGAYHYTEKTLSKQSLKERQLRDILKDDLANQHGVDVIRINCSASRADFIKAQILQSKLAVIFDLSLIDWELCDEKSQKNLVKRACELYMEHTNTLIGICRQLHISRDTLHRYLKAGVRFGWCDYNAEEYTTHSKRINVFDCNGNLIHNFASIRETARQMHAIYNININRTKLMEACVSNKPYQGFNFILDNTTE